MAFTIPEGLHPDLNPVMNLEVQIGFLGAIACHLELGPIALEIAKRNTPDAQLTVAGVAASQQTTVEV